MPFGVVQRFEPGRRLRARNIRQPEPFSCMLIKRALVLSFTAISVAGGANAQSPPGPVTPPAQTAPPSPAAAVNCAPMQPAPGSPDRTTGKAAEPLGDKLARSDGVLCPPAGVDPEIRAPTPDAGKTPVIPPPGSPGGDPSIRPK